MRTRETTARRAAIPLLLLTLAAAPWGCAGDDGDDGEPVVVVYTALDRILSEPILHAFEQQTGIRARPVYDVEAAKTTGLVSRLLARREAPDCDVFWNNEMLQTMRLAELGLLATYRSPQARRIPQRYRDPAGRWTGFAARMRLIIYNRQRVASDDPPRSLQDLIDPRWHANAAIARPFFGTTLTHMVLLHEAWGAQRLAGYCGALRANGVVLAPGNAAVRDLVARGEVAFGLTDTDDAHAAVLAGRSVGVVVPDADQGVVLIPNTVAMISGCEHPESARMLIDFLLSPEVERRLAAGRGAQIPLGSDLSDVRTPWRALAALPELAVDPITAAASVDAVVAILREAGMDQ